MKFVIEATAPSTNARAGVITTDHGTIPTPIFMPVGTCGAMKGVHMRELRDDIKARIILGNTYHLYLRPGTDILRKAGGLHRFGGWEGPILTDSIQRAIGSDIMMALDECPPGMSDKAYARKSLDLTLRWLDRGWKHFNETEPLYGHSQSFFPIVQGCTYPDLRRESAMRVAELGADGNAIGGLAVGEPAEVMYDMIEVVNDVLPADRPRYLMGVGTPANILEAIDRGVDMMDCVMPTRNGRNGMLFTPDGIMNMRNRKWAEDFSPIQPDSECFVDRVYTKAYLRHLFIAGELLAMQIASIHNLAFYLWLVGESRRHIVAGDFATWKPAMIERVTRRI